MSERVRKIPGNRRRRLVRTVVVTLSVSLLVAAAGFGFGYLAGHALL